VAVSYALTDRGVALMPALEQISLWAQEHLVDDEAWSRTAQLGCRPARPTHLDRR
jgi:DNA-binding HxlR family transcriptional regulator